MSKGTLYIISAPSGCGKTSLVTALIKNTSKICASISYTTRPVRPGEKNGINYYFVNSSEFEKLISTDSFLEYAQVFGYYYGTRLTWVQKQLDSGQDVILEIDWQGARQIKLRMPQAMSIFILPPSLESLQKRLQSRGQDTSLIIQKRMKQAKSEISHYNEYNYLIVNTCFEQAITDLKSIIIANRLSEIRQTRLLAPLIKELLQ